VDEFGTQLTDALLDRPDRSKRELHQWAVNGDDIVQLRYMDEVVPSDEGHLLIDLCDDDPRSLCSGLGIVTRYPEGAIALFIGLTHRDQCDIDRIDTIPKEVWEFMEVTREIVDTLIQVSGAAILVKEVKDGMYMPHHLWAEVPRLGKVQHVEGFHVREALAIIVEGFGEAAGGCHSMAKDQEVPALYCRSHGFEGGRSMASNVLLPGSAH
jgi:hypothetical protein